MNREIKADEIKYFLEIFKFVHLFKVDKVLVQFKVFKLEHFL